MKLSQILSQLFKELPKYTDFFSTKVPIQSLSLSGNTVTATTLAPHNFAVGNTVNITGAIIQNPITSLQQTNNIATAFTQFDHDLTEGFNQNVTIVGANQADYNGTFPLLTVPNRRTFTYPISNNPVSPATGSPLLVEVDCSVNPYNGLKVITSVPSSTTFTYVITNPVYSPPTGTIIASSLLRIGGVLTVEKAAEWYSKQSINNYWLFVVLDDSIASKDKYTDDDAVATIPDNTRFRQRIIFPFSCYLFIPLPDDTTRDMISGRKARDDTRDVLYALCKSLLRLHFSTQFSDGLQSGVAFVGDGVHDYNHAVYIHRYMFEYTIDITFEDTIEPSPNVAFRDLQIDFQRLTDDYIISTMAINLDDQPL